MTRGSPAAQPVRTVIVVAKIGPPEGVRIVRELARWLEQRKIAVHFEEETAAALGKVEFAMQTFVADLGDKMRAWSDADSKLIEEGLRGE